MNSFFLAMTIDIQAETSAVPVFELFGIPVNDTTIIGWVISLVLVGASIIITRNLKIIPGGIQNVLESFLEYIIDLIEGTLEGKGKALLPFIATIALFIGVSNLIGMLPLIKNPTADLNVTAAFGISVFLYCQFYAIKAKGLWKYIKGFAEPMFFMFPINVIGELAKPVSHSFRLYGNVFGGSIIVVLAYYFVPGIIPVPFIAWFDLFIGVVQALIFTMLSVAYISIAAD